MHRRIPHRAASLRRRPAQTSTLRPRAQGDAGARARPVQRHVLLHLRRRRRDRPLPPRLRRPRHHAGILLRGRLLVE